MDISSVPKFVKETVVVMAIGLGELRSMTDIARADGLLDWINWFPETSVAMLRAHSASIVPCLSSHLMAVWDASAFNSALRSCLVADALAKQVARRNELAAEQRYPPTKLSVGLACGPCVVQRDQGKYVNVFGDPVNTAVRIQQRTRQLGVAVLADKSLVMLGDCAIFKEVEPGNYALTEVLTRA